MNEASRNKTTQDTNTKYNIDLIKLQFANECKKMLYANITLKFASM